MIESCKLIVRMALAVFLIMTQSPAFAQDIGVRADLSASTITRDESVVLTITAIGVDAELDASSLNEDFTVVGRSSSRQLSTVIGSNNQAVNTSVVTWALELMPKGQGVFTVPAIRVGSFETQLLSLTVNAVPQGAKRDIFLETSVDTTSPWVQSQVVMTLRVFQAIEIVDGGLDVPSAPDLVVERIGDDTRHREVRDGREYSVTERRFALFPQKSGNLTIDPVTLSVTVPAEPDRVRGFFSPTRKLTRASDAVTLNVQARPPSGTAWWLPAQKVSLQSQWQGESQAAQVDQPLTRTIVMRAEGVLESQLPQISIPAIDGLSLYAEDPQLGMGAADSGLVSEQRINWALIPQRSGTLTLPAIRVEWFNTLTGQTQTAELPAETIDVEPAIVGGSNPNSKNAQSAALIDSTANPTTVDTNIAAGIESQVISPSVSSNDGLLASTANLMSERVNALESALQRWQWFAFIALALWILTVVAWLLQRSRGFRPSGEKLSDDNPRNRSVGRQMDVLYQQLAPMNQIDKTCKQGDLLDVKRSLLEWSAHQWPAEPPTTLDALQAKLPAGAARDKLAKVTLALYSKQGYADIMPALADELVTLPRDLKTALQQTSADQVSSQVARSAANEKVALSKGSSRLPQL